MEIQRINTYRDSRFSQRVLFQHGAYLLDEKPYEVEFCSAFDVILRGPNPECYHALIEEFRFHAPHASNFYDEKGNLLKAYPLPQLLSLSLEDIQPSQFYVDEEKLAAVGQFIQSPEDVIVQVHPYGNRYFSLDGHTRLYYAWLRGFPSVKAVEVPESPYILDFVDQAQRRGVYAPKDLMLLPHRLYEEKWNAYCDSYFSARSDFSK